MFSIGTWMLMFAFLGLCCLYLMADVIAEKVFEGTEEED